MFSFRSDIVKAWSMTGDIFVSVYYYEDKIDEIIRLDAQSGFDHSNFYIQLNDYERFNKCVDKLIERYQSRGFTVNYSYDKIVNCNKLTISW